MVLQNVQENQRSMLRNEFDYVVLKQQLDGAPREVLQNNRVCRTGSTPATTSVPLEDSPRPLQLFDASR